MTIIEGMQFDVKSEEIKKIVSERLGHHERKAKVYAEKAGELGASIKAIEEDLEVGKVSGGTPIERLEQKAREHADKANMFRFMLEHVIVEGTYRLKLSDLSFLGISPDRHY